VMSGNSLDIVRLNTPDDKGHTPQLPVYSVPMVGSTYGHDTPTNVRCSAERINGNSITMNTCPQIFR